MLASTHCLFNDSIPVLIGEIESSPKSIRNRYRNQKLSKRLQLKISTSQSFNHEKELEVTLSCPKDFEFRYSASVSEQDYFTKSLRHNWTNDFYSFQEGILKCVNLIHECRMSPLECSLSSNQESCRLEFSGVEKSQIVCITLSRFRTTPDDTLMLLQETRNEMEEQAKTIASLRDQCVRGEERFRNLETKWISCNEEMEITEREMEAQLKDQESELKYQDLQLKRQENTLSEQDLKLKEQEVHLKEQADQLKDQDLKLKHQENSLSEQGLKLKEQELQLKEQANQLKEQDRKLRDQEVDLKKITVLEKKLEKFDECKELFRGVSIILAECNLSLRNQNKRVSELEHDLDAANLKKAELDEQIKMLQGSNEEANLKLKEQEIKLKDQGEKIHELENVLDVSTLKNKEQGDELMKLGASIEELNREKIHIEEALGESDRRLELVQEERDQLLDNRENLEEELNALHDEKKELQNDLKYVRIELSAEKRQKEHIRTDFDKAFALLSKCMDKTLVRH